MIFIIIITFIYLIFFIWLVESFSDGSEKKISYSKNPFVSIIVSAKNEELEARIATLEAS